MLDLINKLLSGLKEKLVSAWNWFTGLFSSSKKAEETKTISKEQVAKDKQAVDLTNEIMDLPEDGSVTGEQLEDYITKLESFTEEKRGNLSDFLVRNFDLYDKVLSLLSNTSVKIYNNLSARIKAIAVVSFEERILATKEVFECSTLLKEEFGSSYVDIVEESK